MTGFRMDFLLAAMLIVFAAVPAFTGAIPPVDARFQSRNTNTPVTLTTYASREAWLARADFLRHQILMAAGLWPMPERTPLNAQIFGRIDGNGYSIEKVFFESYPGFYCTGNLYRPRGKQGPFPAVWSPHGHWAYGRLENTDVASVPARAINLARQGYVVFTPDMVGYNDSRQVSHQYGGPRQQLWGVNVLGLQLWNSIRGLDFLQSLPDVDPNRLAATGASGGGTQTFLLTAVDERVKASAPVNMISTVMQGGSNCENAANLRIDTNNVEIGSLAAPRPLLMVAATGDWTKSTPAVEFPAVQSIYRLLNAEDRVVSKQFDAPHNYNRNSRETVYAFFGKELLSDNDSAHFKERSIHLEFPSDMVVFYNRTRPQGVTEESLFEQRIADSERQLIALRPADKAGTERFKQVMGAALRQSVAAEMPAPDAVLAEQSAGGQVVIGRNGKGDRIPGAWFRPKRAAKNAGAVLLIHPDGREAAGKSPLAAELLKRGIPVFSIDTFQTGEHTGKRDMSDRFFTTYNRTDDAERVQDILTAIAYLKARADVRDIDIVGAGRAGLWVLLARALAPAEAVRRTAADAVQFDAKDDSAYLDKLFIPLIRRAGDFRTVETLIAPAPVFIHNTGTRFGVDWANNAFAVAGATDKLAVRQAAATDEEIAAWLTSVSAAGRH